MAPRLDLTLLMSFEFNSHAPAEVTVYIPVYTTSLRQRSAIKALHCSRGLAGDIPYMLVNKFVTDIFMLSVI